MDFFGLSDATGNSRLNAHCCCTIISEVLIKWISMSFQELYITCRLLFLTLRRMRFCAASVRSDSGLRLTNYRKFLKRRSVNVFSSFLCMLLLHWTTCLRLSRYATYVWRWGFTTYRNMGVIIYLISSWIGYWILKNEMCWLTGYKICASFPFLLTLLWYS